MRFIAAQVRIPRDTIMSYAFKLGATSDGNICECGGRVAAVKTGTWHQASASVVPAHTRTGCWGVMGQVAMWLDQAYLGIWGPGCIGQRRVPPSVVVCRGSGMCMWTPVGTSLKMSGSSDMLRVEGLLVPPRYSHKPVPPL
jgi:hypothetical protein